MPVWLTSAQWLENSNFEAASASLPQSLRESDNIVAWNYRPADGPDEFDIAELKAAALETDPGSETACILFSRETNSAELLDRLKTIASKYSAPVRSADPLLDKVPYVNKLYKNVDGEENAPQKMPYGQAQLRAAAIEAWSMVLSAGHSTEADWAEIAKLADGSPSTQVQSEVYRSIGRGIAPTRLPEVAEWITSDETGIWPAPLRRAVLDGCLLHASLHPDNGASIDVASLLRLQYDTDSGVRMRVGRLAAITRAADTLPILESQTTDVDPRIRSAAYINLGLVGGENAKTILTAAANDTAENVRASATLGLGLMGIARTESVIDESAAVRQAAAKAFSIHPGTDAARSLTKLVSDPDRQVQSAVVDNLSAWPDDLAVPVLATALVESSSNARLEALKEIRKRTGITEAFVVEAGKEERRQTIDKWRSTFGLKMLLPTDVVSGEKAGSISGGPSYLNLAFDQLDNNPGSQQAWDILSKVHTGDLPALEQILADRRANNRPSGWPKLWDEILPALREDLKALEDLRSNDINVRVIAAGQLAVFAEQNEPSAIVTAALPDIMATEQNANVWRNIMQVVSQHRSQATEQILPLALNAQWADVRLEACKMIGTNGSPEYAVWLRPLLQDSDYNVRLAAVRAIGQCKHPALIDGPDGGLRKLLASPSQEMRLAAATSMAQLGDTSGMQLLLTLAHSDDVMLRRQAVGGIASAATPAFADPVLQLAWTERDGIVRDRYLDVLARINPAAANWPRNSDYSQKLQLWSNATGVQK